jgi:hypothetical protein
MAAERYQGHATTEMSRGKLSFQAHGELKARQGFFVPMQMAEKQAALKVPERKLRTQAEHTVKRRQPCECLAELCLHEREKMKRVEGVIAALQDGLTKQFSFRQVPGTIGRHGLI